VFVYPVTSIVDDVRLTYYPFTPSYAQTITKSQGQNIKHLPFSVFWRHFPNTNGFHVLFLVGFPFKSRWFIFCEIVLLRTSTLLFHPLLDYVFNVSRFSFLSVAFLGATPGDCHDGGLRMNVEGAPKLVVAEWSWRAEYDAFLHAVHLLLCRLGEPNEVQEDGVLWIRNAKLLVKGVTDGVE